LPQFEQSGGATPLWSLFGYDLSLQKEKALAEMDANLKLKARVEKAFFPS
jgi:hypothetical protein